MKEDGEEKPQSSPSVVPETTTTGDRKSSRGIGSAIWGAMGLLGSLFTRGNKNDFEKRLQHLTKEEVAVHTRLKRRTQRWRKVARAMIIYSIVGEVGFRVGSKPFLSLKGYRSLFWLINGCVFVV